MPCHRPRARIQQPTARDGQTDTTRRGSGYGATCVVASRICLVYVNWNIHWKTAVRCPHGPDAIPDSTNDVLYSSCSLYIGYNVCQYISYFVYIVESRMVIIWYLYISIVFGRLVDVVRCSSCPRWLIFGSRIIFIRASSNCRVIDVDKVMGLPKRSKFNIIARAFLSSNYLPRCSSVYLTIASYLITRPFNIESSNRGTILCM